MKRLFCFAVGAFLLTASPARAQQLRIGVTAGPSWAVGDAGSSLDAGYGGEGWVALELPGLPISPRAAFAVDRFTRPGTLDMKGGRLDLLWRLPGVVLEPYGFVGSGVYDSDYKSLGSQTLPIDSFDPEVSFAAGLGAGIQLGPVRGIAEGRYVAVTHADFQALQLRVGIAF